MKMKNRFLGILLSLVMVLGLMPGMSSTAYAESDALYTFAGGTSGSSFYYNITGINDTNASKIKTIEALVWVTGNPDWGFIQVASGGSIKQYIYDNLNKGIHKYIWNVDSPTKTVLGEGSYAQIQLVQASGNAESGKLLAYRVEFSDSTGTITKGDWGNPICVAPTGLTATYGQTLADVTLNNPAGNTAGTWAWVNSTTSVGNVGNNIFKANFTPTDTTQYKDVDNVDITVTVNKAANPLTYTETQTVTKTFSTSAQTATLADATNGQGTVSYEIKSQKDSSNADVSCFSLNGTKLTLAANTPAGTYTVVVRATAAGNDNYNSGTKDSTVTITVSKATAPIVTVPTPGAVTYDPAKTLANVTLSNGWTWVTSTTVPTVGNSGYAAALDVDDDNYNYTSVEGYRAETHKVTRTVSLTVNKATVTPPTIASKTYNTQKQTADVTESTLYTVKTNDGGTNVGEYDVVLTLTDSANYKWMDSEEATKELIFNITKATAPTVTVPTPEAVTYDTAKTLADVNLPEGWSWVTSATVPTVVNGGYSAVLTVDDANYDYTGVDGYDAQAHTVTKTVSLTVNKADPAVTVPTAKKLTYTGKAQELVNAGSTDDGTLYYALGENDTTAPEFDGISEAENKKYTTSIPTKTDIGTYYVWYKVVGDDNHSDTEPASVIATIAPVEPTITGADLVLNGSLDFRFYVALPVNFNANGAHMVFTIHGRTIDVPISQAETAADGKRIFSCPVYSIEMAEDVKAEFHYKSGTATLTTSIDKYLNKLSEQSGNSQKLTDLINAVRDYGHYIQPYLSKLHNFKIGSGGYAVMPAASSITPVTAEELDNYKTVWNDYNTSVLDSVSYYDTFAESTTLHVLVKLKSAKNNITATVNGTDCDVADLGSNTYGIEIPDIAANNLGVKYKVVFSESGTTICDIDVSALTYVRAVLASRSETGEAEALTAFYKYYKAAFAYGQN